MSRLLCLGQALIFGTDFHKASQKYATKSHEGQVLIFAREYLQDFLLKEIHYRGISEINMSSLALSLVNASQQ